MPILAVRAVRREEDRTRRSPWSDRSTSCGTSTSRPTRHRWSRASAWTPMRSPPSSTRITVAEHGYAVAVSELLLNASFDDVMASASRLLGATWRSTSTGSARDTLLTGTSRGLRLQAILPEPSRRSARTTLVPRHRPGCTGHCDQLVYLIPAAVKDGVETLATKNVPRLGETYVCFIHPHQSRDSATRRSSSRSRSTPHPATSCSARSVVSTTSVFIETTQIKTTTGGPTPRRTTRS